MTTTHERATGFSILLREQRRDCAARPVFDEPKTFSVLRLKDLEVVDVAMLFCLQL
jgi:hypothetical protein